MRHRRSVLWLVLVGLWTLFGLLAASQVYFDSLARGRPLSPLQAFVWQMPAYYALALGTPLVLWLARRFPFERRGWLRRLLFHAAASFVFSAVITVFHIINDLLHTKGVEGLTLLDVSRPLILVFDRVVFVYWTVLLLSHAFDYYARYQSGLARTARLESQLARAQLQALKMQLNPHFLFNTLNAISELIHRDPEIADEMITQLSDMLRSTLERTGVQEVSLKQELEFLERYLAIERTRMGGRLRIEMRVAPETLDAQVPNMILQPLVENAVRHGIAPCAEGGCVTISAERVNGSLDLRVSDTGRGLADAAREKTGNGALAPVVNAKGGVGLANTRARLRHLYGERGRFELRGASPHGLAACVSIPFRADAPADDPDDPSLDR